MSTHRPAQCPISSVGFNNQGWDYPRLVDATWNDFWQDVESQLDPSQIPLQRVVDWGTAWEEWPGANGAHPQHLPPGT